MKNPGRLPEQILSEQILPDGRIWGSLAFGVDVPEADTVDDPRPSTLYPRRKKIGLDEPFDEIQADSVHEAGI
jgi:hypothetical protein